MYSRLLDLPDQTFLLLGPRGTGKSTWLRQRLGGSPWFDLLDSETFLDLSARPNRLGSRIPASHAGWVVVDEVQRVPALLDEVHRLVEVRPGLKFALTGSSARKLRRGGVNLLGGRAVPLRMHALTASELGGDWHLRSAVTRGCLPMAVNATDEAGARRYLEGYVGHLPPRGGPAGGAHAQPARVRPLPRGGVLQSGGAAQHGRRRAGTAASSAAWCRGGSRCWRTCSSPSGSRCSRGRASRPTTAHPKFFYFDAGVYRALRPRGPLDSADEIDGAALETLLFQQARALSDTSGLGYTWSHWRTRSGDEVDLVGYGERGLVAFEVKRTDHLRAADLRGLRAFRAEYPEARTLLLYGGERTLHDDGVDVVPFDAALRDLRGLLERGGRLG
jgi:predicted AAA+ superfamily ATPase